MRQVERDTESWKRMVLRSMPKPAWLSPDAPQGDVVLSSRTRVMRNLREHRFPSKASSEELLTVMRKVLDASRETNLELEAFKSLTNAERDYLVGCRLVSPDFEWTLPGRALLLDQRRSLSLMVNEEDHLRLQALTAGWSPQACDDVAKQCHDSLSANLEFAWSPDYGFLASSPYNCGLGKRQSAMLHLIGLAQGKRLPQVMKALSARGIVVRGLFGESSRAIGAFVQVSVISASREEFIGAVEYLMKEERDARSQLGREVLADRAHQAREYVVGARGMSLSESLRVLAWSRWAASASIGGFSFSPREVDATLTTIEIHPHGQEEVAARQRADQLRGLFER